MMLIGVAAGGAGGAAGGVGVGLGKGLGDGDVVDVDGEIVREANTGDGEASRTATTGLLGDCLDVGGCASVAAASIAIPTEAQPAAARILFEERKTGSRVLNRKTLNERRTVATERSPKTPRAGFVGS